MASSDAVFYGLAGALVVWSFIRYRRGQLIRRLEPAHDTGTVEAIDLYWRPG